MITIRDLMTDSDLFGEQFGGESFAAWRALLAGFYGLELTDNELPHWQALTDRQSAPEAAHDELWLAIGRRGGKSNMAALLAVFEACFNDHRPNLAPGEVATVMVLAADRKQARSVFRYISGLMNANPMLARLIIKESTETLELANRAVIEVGTASFRATRGYTFAAVIADEIAFWRSEDSANPDYEILNAVRPGLATLDGPLIALSSPYSRRGALWEAYRRHYGQEGGILVAQAPTLTMNPTLPRRLVDQALARDPAAASAEYLAQFRDDITGFITRELVDSNARTRPLILPAAHINHYSAFVDVAGGGADEYTLAISHKEDERTVIDGIWAEHGDPAIITASYARVMRQYGISQCTGDRYAAEWPRQEYRKHGITMENSELNRSELYLELMPMLQTGSVELPPDEKALLQLTLLERRTGRSGRDIIDHAPQGHDDRANAIAGAAQLAMAKRYKSGMRRIPGMA
ncbi:MAG: hypothetical protein WD623_16920 [Marinobacter sp.]|uniref:hypothetical protein n=1 Tax=Marinobacter sp. TaxID=50741 RepID=UPI00349FE166